MRAIVEIEQDIIDAFGGCRDDLEQELTAALYDRIEELEKLLDSADSRMEIWRSAAVSTDHTDNCDRFEHLTPDQCWCRVDEARAAEGGVVSDAEGRP